MENQSTDKIQGKVKRKVGRPKKEDNLKTNHVAVHLSDHELKVLNALRERLNISNNSEVIRFLINKQARTLGVTK